MPHSIKSFLFQYYIPYKHTWNDKCLLPTGPFKHDLFLKHECMFPSVLWKFSHPDLVCADYLSFQSYELFSEERQSCYGVVKFDGRSCRSFLVLINDQYQLNVHVHFKCLNDGSKSVTLYSERVRQSINDVSTEDSSYHLFTYKISFHTVSFKAAVKDWRSSRDIVTGCTLV